MIGPLHDWHRNYPAARRIAARLLADPAILALRTRRLVPDVRERYGVSVSAAHIAVGMARLADREGRDAGSLQGGGE